MVGHPAGVTALFGVGKKTHTGKTSLSLAVTGNKVLWIRSMRNKEDTQEAKDWVVFPIQVSTPCLRSLSTHLKIILTPSIQSSWAMSVDITSHTPATIVSWDLPLRNLTLVQKWFLTIVALSQQWHEVAPCSNLYPCLLRIELCPAPEPQLSDTRKKMSSD